jgi:hypothetical protein
MTDQAVKITKAAEPSTAQMRRIRSHKRERFTNMRGESQWPSNALAQLQAHYHHCGEAASEKCCLLQRSSGTGNPVLRREVEAWNQESVPAVIRAG